MKVNILLHFKAEIRVPTGEPHVFSESIRVLKGVRDRKMSFLSMFLKTPTSAKLMTLKDLLFALGFATLEPYPHMARSCHRFANQIPLRIWKNGIN